MRATRFIYLAAGLLVLAGCWQKSVYPFYTSRDLAPDGNLVGTWEEAKESDDKQRWVFKQADAQSYGLEIVDSKENKRPYLAHLFKFEGQRFLDVVPPPDRQVSAIPAHHLFRLSEVSSTLKIAPLNPEWIAEYLKTSPTALQHIKTPDPEHPEDREKDEFILTADTQALQSFLRKHLDEEKLFVEPDTFNKVGEKAAAK